MRKRPSLTRLTPLPPQLEQTAISEHERFLSVWEQQTGAIPKASLRISLVKATL